MWNAASSSHIVSTLTETSQNHVRTVCLILRIRFVPSVCLHIAVENRWVGRHDNLCSKIQRRPKGEEAAGYKHKYIIIMYPAYCQEKLITFNANFKPLMENKLKLTLIQLVWHL